MDALEKGDLHAMRTVPKADLHNHGACRRAIFERITGVTVPPLQKKLQSLHEMEEWVQRYVGDVLNDAHGRQLAVRGAFTQALEDGVTVLSIGEDVWAKDALFDGSVANIVEMLRREHSDVAPEIEFQPVIGLSRHCSIDNLTRWIEPFLEEDFFSALDLYCDELAQPIRNFKGIYREAKSRGKTLRAHAGEWGDADSVKEAVEELELDEIQHGISAAASPPVMKWLADHGIRLNICPTSNVMLERVNSLDVHPIRTLYDNGVCVTVNTDASLVFGQTVSDEFMNLYRIGLFSAMELDQIRRNGLRTSIGE